VNPATGNVARRVGRYEIVRELGRGGMAVVYLARQLDLEREVALKELAVPDAPDLRTNERFLQESRMAASLAHANTEFSATRR
jgi:serine/threonine protein kinase